MPVIARFYGIVVKIFDFKPLLKEEVYKDLSNPSFFKMAKIDAGGYGIFWNDIIDISDAPYWLEFITRF